MRAMMLAIVLTGVARAEPCPGLSRFAAGAGVEALPEGCPAPLSGWLYTQRAHDQVGADLGRAADVIDGLANENEQLRRAVLDAEEPPNRVTWFLTGAAAAAAIALAIYAGG